MCLRIKIDPSSLGPKQRSTLGHSFICKSGPSKTFTNQFSLMKAFFFPSQKKQSGHIFSNMSALGRRTAAGNPEFKAHACFHRSILTGQNISGRFFFYKILTKISSYPSCKSTKKIKKLKLADFQT